MPEQALMHRLACVNQYYSIGEIKIRSVIADINTGIEGIVEHKEKHSQLPEQARGQVILYPEITIRNPAWERDPLCKLLHESFPVIIQPRVNFVMNIAYNPSNVNYFTANLESVSCNESALADEIEQTVKVLDSSPHKIPLLVRHFLPDAVKNDVVTKVTQNHETYILPFLRKLKEDSSRKGLKIEVPYVSLIVATS